MTYSTSRRDPRHAVPLGHGAIELTGPDGSRTSGNIRTLSVSGVGYEIVTDERGARPNEVVLSCALRVGQLEIRGEVAVRDHRTLSGGVTQFGALFYPEAGDAEHHLRCCVESLETGQDIRTEERSQGRGGLYLRCGRCHRAQWIDSASARAACSCGQALDLGEYSEVTLREQLGQTARELGRQHHVDLPAAHSVVIGAMSLEQAIELGHASSPACRLIPDAATSDQRHRYDPAYDEAVRAGLLSPLQAFERGRRESLAQRLTERHGISLRRAYEVADNRISLLQAIRTAQLKQTGAQAWPKETAGRSQFSWTTALAVVVAGTIALGGVNRLQRRPLGVEAEMLPAVVRPGSTSAAETSAASPMRAATQVERDESGRIVRAVGPDPRSVLLAACESMPGYEPIEVTSAFPPAANARLGIVRDSSNLELAVLPLRRDASTRRWLAGDGREPLRPSTPTGQLLEALSRQ